MGRAIGFDHAEAFCLMTYACTCGHREVLWNSRDGVTPFCLGCPSCGQPDLTHKMALMKFAPGHKPHHGQRIFVSMTRERAEYLARRRLVAHYGESGTEARVLALANSFWENGAAPDIKVVE